MGNKVTTLYDFTLTANGSQEILADANFYKVLTSTGDISITRNGGSTIKPLRAGRGERNVEFLRLLVRDLSGAPNSGTILVGDSDFIDDTIVLSSAINVRPEAHSGDFKSMASLASNVSETIFTPALNTGGAILLTAEMSSYDAASFPNPVIVAKSSAPTTPLDGVIYLASKLTAYPGANSATGATLPKEQLIPAGLGLYFISSGGFAANQCLRTARYKLL
jgi:hypothetical protein